MFWTAVYFSIAFEAFINCVIAAIYKFQLSKILLVFYYSTIRENTCTIPLLVTVILIHSIQHVKVHP